MPASALVRLVAGLVIVFFCVAGDRPRPADIMDLYVRAVEFDPVFQRARYEREVAQQALKESRAGAYPAVSASVEGSKTYQDIERSQSIFFTEGRTDFFSQAYSISLTQAIYRYDLFTRIPQARAETRQAEALFAAAEQDLMFRLAQAHFNFLAARDNLELAIAERTAIWRQLQEAEERLGSGLANITDVQDARARFALAQASEIDAADALEEGRQAIAEITGEPPLDLKLLSEAFPLVRADRPEIEAWVETAIFQNPRIRAFEAAVEAAEQEIRRQRAARLPYLDLVASYNNRDSGGTIFGGGNVIATTDVALRLGIPIVDGGRRSALAEGASLRHGMALQELEREKRRVERETRVAFQGVMSGITRVEALGKSVFSHEAALAAKDEGWRSGVNTGLAVLDARRELFSARRDLAHARYLYILNGLKLKQSAGALGVRDLREINAYLQ